MKRILVITRDYNTSQSIATILQDNPEYSLAAAVDELEAVTHIRGSGADLLVIDLATRESAALAPLKELLRYFPYIPCIAIINSRTYPAEELLELGISTCLDEQDRQSDFQHWVNKLLEESTTGTMKGLPIPSLLQMLEGEEKTCTLQISTQDAEGYIYLKNGSVIESTTIDQTGEDALYSIMTWQDTTVSIKFFNKKLPVAIDKPLMSLIMEAFRLKDEKESILHQNGLNNTSTNALKHFSTTGRRLALEIGLPLKLEAENEEDPEPLASSLAGLVPDKYLIISKPDFYTPPHGTQDNNVKFLVKYMQMGRLCMFRTVVLNVPGPQELLFLDYPLVIHYHELRQFKRTAIFVPCILKISSGPKYNSILLDLSPTGCQCQIKNSQNETLPDIGAGDTVSLYTMFPGAQERYELPGVVKNVKRSPVDMRLGVQLAQLSQEVTQLIKRYVESLEA